MTVSVEDIQGNPNITNEMKKLLLELREMIDYARKAGRNIESITLSRKQWEPIRKDRKRAKWDAPRGCGLIHYADSEPSFDSVNLSAPSDRDFKDYMQEDLFHAHK